MDETQEPTLSIGAVERDTGLSKDTLRVWERRYGFPAPQRGASGERCYLRADLHKLRIVKRLLDAGQRPGRIVRLPLEALQQLAQPAPAQAGRHRLHDLPAMEIEPLLDLLRSHDVGLLRNRLGWLLTRLGLGRFTTEVIGPLTQAVGEAWARARLDVFEEHLYTEVVQGLLRQAIASLPQLSAGAAPRVLLTTVPGEQHGLGLLMAEAMLVLEDCCCQSLGVQTPLAEIPSAAAAHRAHIVALSFSSMMSSKAVIESLTELRSTLPPQVQLWAGGGAPVLRRRAIDGVVPITTLEAIPLQVQQLRRYNNGAAA
jgi:DNA-binding transcriptional MerR regulator/methylmalonyl-CoA mutase cobalamin-binding subunit